MDTWIRRHKRTWRWLLTAGVALAAGGLARAGAPVLKPGARLAFVGDSITAQKLYTTYIEAYLLACRPELKVSVMQLGWGGEVAPGFLARMDDDLLPWRPDAVTVCYGMNDGRYRRYSEETGATYRQAMEGIVSGIKAAGAAAVVGGPGVVDTRYFQQGNMADAAAIARMLRDANEYNDTLGKLSELAQQVAAGNGMPFADVHGVMAAAMPKAKAAYGDEYAIAPGGVHPPNNGHLLMAYAFLKALGVEGPIGTITAQWGGKAVATSGHTVRAFKPLCHQLAIRPLQQ